jgi:DNA-binding winged helix-turn-helix (wHTH) protein/TolB-like protein
MQERGSILEFGPFRLDLLRRSLERDGQPIALSGKALEILAILLERRGEVVDKNDLMRQVWPDTAVEENNITVAISALRKALGETPSATKWIVTIPGRGYSFAGLVASQPLRAVAILPFSVLDQDGRNEYLGLGLADAVVTRLGNTPLIVRPLASVSRFVDQDPLQTGRDLEVDAVVVGNVRTADDLIRVSVQLFRVRDSQLLWAQNFDVTADHTFTLEDSISERIVAHLAERLTGEQKSALNRPRTENPSAYTNYLRGRYYAKKYSEAGFHRALDYLQAAIDSDPGYALAHSGLADLFYDA